MNLDCAVRVDDRLGLGALAAPAPGGASAADTSFDRSRRTARLFVLCFPAESLSPQFVLFAANFRLIIFDAQLDWIHVHLHGEFIHDRFHPERCRGMAGRAKGSRRSGIDCDTGLFGADVWNLVNIWRRKIRPAAATDRKSTRLNSSHGYISYAVFCLK